MGPGGPGQPGAGPGQSGPGYPGGGPNGPGQPGPGGYGPGTPGGGRGTRWPGGQPRRPSRPSAKGSPSQAAGRAVSAIRRATGSIPAPARTGSWDRTGGTVIRQTRQRAARPAAERQGPHRGDRERHVGAFARDLRVLRSKAGLDYPDMAEKSHYTMRTLASAAGGLRLPTLPVLIAYVKACAGDVAEWEERWGKLVRSGRRARPRSPPPARTPPTTSPASSRTACPAPPRRALPSQARPRRTRRGPVRSTSSRRPSPARSIGNARKTRP